MLKFSGDKQLKKNKKSEIKKPKTPHNSHVQIVEIICDSCKWQNNMHALVLQINK